MFFHRSEISQVEQQKQLEEKRKEKIALIETRREQGIKDKLFGVEKLHSKRV